MYVNAWNKPLVSATKFTAPAPRIPVPPHIAADPLASFMAHPDQVVVVSGYLGPEKQPLAEQAPNASGEFAGAVHSTFTHENWVGGVRKDHHLVAIRTGVTRTVDGKPAGFIVVDTDTQSHPIPIRLLNLLFKTAGCISRTPGGFHFIYLIGAESIRLANKAEVRCRNQAGSFVELKGLDIRSHNGIIYGPGTKYPTVDATGEVMIRKYELYSGTLQDAVEMPSELFELVNDYDNYTAEAKAAHPEMALGRAPAPARNVGGVRKAAAAKPANAGAGVEADAFPAAAAAPTLSPAKQAAAEIRCRDLLSCMTSAEAEDTELWKKIMEGSGTMTQKSQVGWAHADLASSTATKGYSQKQGRNLFFNGNGSVKEGTLHWIARRANRARYYTLFPRAPQRLVPDITIGPLRELVSFLAPKFRHDRTLVLTVMGLAKNILPESEAEEVEAMMTDYHGIVAASDVKGLLAKMPYTGDADGAVLKLLIHMARGYYATQTNKWVRQYCPTPPTARAGVLPYEEMKAKREETTFKLMSPPSFIRLITRAPFVEQLSERDIIVQLKHMQCTAEVTARDGTTEIKAVNFVEKWLHDPAIRIMERTDFFPNPADCDADVYNTYRDMEGARLLDLHGDKINNASAKAGLRRFQEILFNLANRRIKVYRYLVRWLALAVQFPWIVPGVMIIIQGLQGCGKTIGIEFLLKHVFGRQHTIKCAKPEEEVFGTHAVAQDNIIFSFLEELATIVGKKHLEQFNDMITADEGGIRRMYIASRMQRVYNSWIAATNKPFFDPQRRHMCMHAGIAKIYDRAHWIQTAKWFGLDASQRPNWEFPEIGAAVYNWLKNTIDLTDFDVRVFPQTEHRADLQRATIPWPKKFVQYCGEELARKEGGAVVMIDMVDAESKATPVYVPPFTVTERKMTCQTLYNGYKAWSLEEAGGIESAIPREFRFSLGAFGGKMSELAEAGLLEKDRSRIGERTGTVYTLNLEAITASMPLIEDPDDRTVALPPTGTDADETFEVPSMAEDDTIKSDAQPEPVEAQAAAEAQAEAETEP